MFHLFPLCETIIISFLEIQNVGFLPAHQRLVSNNTIFLKQLFTKVEVASGGYFNRAAKRRGKYPLLAIDTEVNSCFRMY